MLHLTTGANGAGKTLFTLKDVRERQLKELRPVAYNGRFKLKPEVEREFGWKCIDFKDWQQEPDGTIFLIDECHNDLPKRPSSAPVPDHVRMLAEHRARGFDFYLITQHPSNVDSFVTRLVGSPGWHRHLKRAFGGSNMVSHLQWDAVNHGCERNKSGASAQVTMKAFPKEVYGWYDSAELHTARLKIPKAVYIVAVALVVVPALGWFGYRTLMGNVMKHAAVQPAAPVAKVTSPAGVERVAASGPISTMDYIGSFVPRVPGLPHTASRYDKLTEPDEVPMPAACVEMKSIGCRCYTQQGTRLPRVGVDLCRQIVAGGFFEDFSRGRSAQKSATGGLDSARPAPGDRPGNTDLVTLPGHQRSGHVSVADVSAAYRAPGPSPLRVGGVGDHQ